MKNNYDVIILGGGLSGGLLSYRLKQLQPNLDFLLIEKGDTLGGDHTWCFHKNDVAEDDFNWLSPLIVKSWDQHEVKFPNYSRMINSSYHAMKSARFHEVLFQALKNHLLLGTSVKKASENEVILHDETVLQAKLVIDARGLRSIQDIHTAYQKFIGLELELETPHGKNFVTLMDTLCDQTNGYRFFYVLPWDDTKLLIEDTYYHESGKLDDKQIEKDILDYANRQGWKVKNILHKEKGVLPIPLTMNFDQSSQSTLPTIGLRGKIFNPTTGYSVPYAVRTANLLAKNTNWNKKRVKQIIQSVEKDVSKQSKFFLLLNRMLFLACKAPERYKVLQRFYTLSESLIHRFYSGTLRKSDYLKVLVGKPPVPLMNAIKSMNQTEKRSSL